MNVNWLNAIIEQRDSELDSPGGSVRGDDEKILWDVRDSNRLPDALVLLMFRNVIEIFRQHLRRIFYKNKEGVVIRLSR